MKTAVNYILFLHFLFHLLILNLQYLLILLFPLILLSLIFLQKGFQALYLYLFPNSLKFFQFRRIYLFLVVQVRRKCFPVLFLFRRNFLFVLSLSVLYVFVLSVLI